MNRDESRSEFIIEFIIYHFASSSQSLTQERVKYERGWLKIFIRKFIESMLKKEEDIRG